MHPMLNRLHRDERGMSMVFVGLGFMAFLAATTLAIDVGMFMTARSQAQTAADSAALSGAIALAFDDYTNRSSSGPAVQSALVAARTNAVVGQTVNIVPSDVTFPLGPTGVNNRVRASVYRTVGRGNAVTTLMGRYFGVMRADITATATAEASKANAMKCVKPFTIPDRWTERQTGPWDEGDTFDMFDNHNRPLATPDIYVPSTSPSYTGYNASRDKGMRLTIRAGSGSNINPTFYFSFAVGNVTGGSEYEEHRRLQYDRDGFWRPPAAGARQHGRTDESRHRRADRPGPECLLGQLGQPAGDQYPPEPAPHRHPGVRSGLLRYRCDPGPNGGSQGGQLHWLLHRIAVGQQRLRPHHAGDGHRAGSQGPAPVGAFPTAIRLVE